MSGSWPLEGSRRTRARAPPATPWNIVLSSDVEREALTAEGADCIEFGALLDDFNILLRDAFYLMRALRTLASEGWWGPDRWNEALYGTDPGAPEEGSESRLRPLPSRP